MTGLSGCSAFTLVNATSPSDHYVRTEDLRYGPGTRQVFDIYRAKGQVATALIIFFYGGGWTEGSKDDYRFVGSSLTREGFAVAIADYRLYPDVVFPTFVEDGARAVAATLEAAGNLGIPTEKVFLMGHSAGAHIAAMLAYDDRFLARQSVLKDRIKGFVGLSGPYDFLPIGSGYLEDVFPPDLREASQPVRYADKGAPPSLLIHGTEDSKVRPSNSESLAAALAQAGVRVKLMRYEGAGHARTVAALAPRFTFLADTLEDTTRFVRAEIERTTPSTPKGVHSGDRQDRAATGYIASTN